MGLLTEHGPEKDHLFRTGCVQDEVCTFCYKEIESAEHVLLDYSALVGKRGKGILIRNVWLLRRLES